VCGISKLESSSGGGKCSEGFTNVKVEIKDGGIGILFL
jgi:hypothetical protein